MQSVFLKKQNALLHRLLLTIFYALKQWFLPYIRKVGIEYSKTFFGSFQACSDDATIFLIVLYPLIQKIEGM